MTEPTSPTPENPEEREWPFPWMPRFLESLALMPNVSAAARAARVNRQYAYEAAKRHPEFQAAWEDALERGIDLLEQHVHRWAAVGIPQEETRVTERRDAKGELVSRETVTTSSSSINATLAMFLLKAYKPEKYRDRVSVEHAGEGGGPVKVEVTREEVEQAVDGFSAEVVRLSDARAARGDAAAGGGA